MKEEIEILRITVGKDHRFAITDDFKKLDISTKLNFIAILGLVLHSFQHMTAEEHNEGAMKIN